MLSPEFIRNEIYDFFANTLKRHGKGERQDIGNSSFQSLLGPENALSDDGSRLKTSCMNDGANRSDKDLSVTDAHKNSGRCMPCLVQDIPWNKIWFLEYASDFTANSSYFASLSSQLSLARMVMATLKSASRIMQQGQIYTSSVDCICHNRFTQTIHCIY